MPDRLHAPRLVVGRKEVLYSPNFKDRTGLVAAGSVYDNDFAEIIDRLAAGRAMPHRFYRAGIDVDDDALLDELGVIHLHLGGKNSDVLLFLVQYPDRVVLLEINSHHHFRSDPPGTLLRLLHERHLNRMAQDHQSRLAAQVAQRAEAVGYAVARLLRSRRRGPPGESD